MWINDPISQLEVYGLLFPNCRSLKSVGILIAETYPPPASLSRPDRGENEEKKTTWIMSKYLKRLMWRRALRLAVSAWEKKKSAETRLKIWGGENMAVYFLSLLFSLSVSATVSSLCLFLFPVLPLCSLLGLMHLVCLSLPWSLNYFRIQFVVPVLKPVMWPSLAFIHIQILGYLPVWTPQHCVIQ